MEIRYKINTQYAMTLSFAWSAMLYMVDMAYMGSNSQKLIKHFIGQPTLLADLAITFLLLTSLSVLLFSIIKRLELVLQDEVIKSSISIFGFSCTIKKLNATDPNVKIIQIDKREQLAIERWLEKKLIKVDNFNTFLIVRDTDIGNKRIFWRIEPFMWQCSDEDELLQYFQQHNHTLEKMPESIAMRTYVSAMQDIGKRAGVVAWWAVACMFVLILLSFINDYLTIAFAYKRELLWIIAMLAGASSLYWMYKGDKKWGMQLVVASLFSACFTFMILIMIEVFVHIFADVQHEQFVFDSINENDMAKWVHIDNGNVFSRGASDEKNGELSFYCPVDKGKELPTKDNQSAKNLEVSRFFGIVQVKYDETCD